jgi:hypothetical protein
MKPIKFEAANTIINNEVPVNQNYGVLLSRWGMSWRERLSILWHGKVWLVIRGDNMPPILLSGDQSFCVDRGELD